MRRILFDTNGYVAFKRGDAGAVHVVRLAERIGMSSVVLGELLAGFAGGTHEGRNRKELAEFLASPRVETLHVGPETAKYYAAVFQSLRRRGKPIPTNDLWIAATALGLDAVVVTSDSDFQRVRGLRIEDWTASPGTSGE